jgi:phosphoenolpyruvate carboxykinase (GTP)
MEVKMDPETMAFLQSRLSERDLQKLARLPQPEMHRFIARYIEICNPARVFVCDDSPDDWASIRQAALRDGEERALPVPGHTVHFDNYYDMARDRKNTRILVPQGMDLGQNIDTRDRDEGLADVHRILPGIMQGHDLYICFFCLGPTGSEFSIPCVQLTDSSYVAHSESLLYRPGYQELIRQGPNARFFRFVHSQGEVDERKTSKNLQMRRVFIDLVGDTVYSVNTQYGGNTLGLKKLAMRLAIYHAAQEGWLCEHMLLMGIHGLGGRVTYIAGGFPSMCGKTSTAMLEGETIVGDDIIYLRRKDGEARAVNVEKGMFGIIQGVNAADDPLIWQALHNPVEVIFSNVLVTPEGQVHWIGRDGEVPPKGENHSGEWWPGKKDAAGKEIPPSHPNARFTLDLASLQNLDAHRDSPEGVAVGAMVYGGRDSDIWVPVEQSFDWAHGVITMGASLESETTAAILGKEGVLEWNPMSNRDFLSISVGRYVQINLDLGLALPTPPQIFSVNYFLRDTQTGRWLNEKTDKKVWYKWIELRVHGEVGALRTPTGYIPRYSDLRRLFGTVLGKAYAHDDYRRQFAILIPENLGKIDRVERLYRTTISDTPEILYQVLDAQRQRLREAKRLHGDILWPDEID